MQTLPKSIAIYAIEYTTVDSAREKLRSLPRQLKRNFMISFKQNSDSTHEGKDATDLGDRQDGW